VTTVTLSQLAALIRQLEAETNRDDAHQLALDSLREAAAYVTIRNQYETTCAADLPEHFILADCDCNAPYREAIARSPTASTARRLDDGDFGIVSLDDALHKRLIGAPVRLADHTPPKKPAAVGTPARCDCRKNGVWSHQLSTLRVT
jgi:hypothetical protein